MRCFLALLSFAALSGAAASPFRGAPLRPDHPLVGLWQLPFPNSSCIEVYRIEANGTTLVTSGREVTESEFTLSDEPSEKGFYLWVDQLVKGNGEADCAGEVTEPGAKSTHYILLHPSGKVFVLCDNEDEHLTTCIGPFVRLEDGDV